MRRHPALQDLSRDHHHVLLHARRLRGEGPLAPPVDVVRRFRQYWDAVLVHHFTEEEAAVLPHVVDAAIAQRVRDEHRGITTHVGRLGRDGTAAELGALLRAHVRFEEDVVFPHLQRTLAPEALASVGSAAQAHRRLLRPGAGPDEACFL